MRTTYKRYRSGLRLEHVGFTAGDKALLDGVSIDVTPGEVVAIVGANGAGKTTALRIAAGDLVPHSGSVKLDGKLLEEHPVWALARRRAVLSQRPTLSFDFTVAEVVMLGRTPHQTRRDVDIAAANRAMETMAVGGFATRRYTTLSGGEQQRVQMARVLAQLEAPPSDEAQYLLLDEPTTALDMACQHQLLRTARACAGNGLGVLLVMHDLNLTAQYADRIVILCGGRVVASGKPWDVLTPSIVRRAFDVEIVVSPHPADKSIPLIVPVPDEPNFVADERRAYAPAPSAALMQTMA